MELAKDMIGAEGMYDVKIEGGKLKLSVGYDGKGADASITIAIDGEYFLDKLATAIPGSIDDAVIAVLKSAMKA